MYGKLLWHKLTMTIGPAGPFVNYIVLDIPFRLTTDVLVGDHVPAVEAIQKAIHKQFRKARLPFNLNDEMIIKPWFIPPRTKAGTEWNVRYATAGDSWKEYEYHLWYLNKNQPNDIIWTATQTKS